MNTRSLSLRQACIAALLVLGHTSPFAQIAKGATKYLGNITTNETVEADFSKYWNHITPENAGKWPSIEATRDNMAWTSLDKTVSYARSNDIPWTFYTLLWGSSYPSWMAAIHKDTLKSEIEEWFSQAGTRYPDADMVIVVNEPSPKHMPPRIFTEALGGAGATGYDGIISAFHLARKAFPQAKLLLNDYNNIEYAEDHDVSLNMVKALLAAKAPIDGIGCEAHDAYKRPLDTLQKYLDSFASTGLPIYITEYDIPMTSDARQDSLMQAQFPLFWNHPGVAGITYWGERVGHTWVTGSGLIQTDGTQRPALVWLEDYVKSHPNPPSPIHTSLATGRKIGVMAPRTLTLRLVEGRLVLGTEHSGRFLPFGATGLR